MRDHLLPPDIRVLIDQLRDLAQARYAQESLCFADGGSEADDPIESYPEHRAAIVLQAVFDPENQPSQFGTTLSP